MTQPSFASTSDRAWRPGPRRPQLEPGALHVWRADLSAVSDELIELLSPPERARGERFSNVRRGRLWSGARGVLRELLGRYLDADPRALALATGAQGKPVLAEDASAASSASRSSPARRPLEFNISHSGQTALLAFTASGPVGVDVELTRRRIDVIAVASRAFGAAAAEGLQALDPSLREREFLRRWTRAEAELKCHGTGIGGSRIARCAGELWVGELYVGNRGEAAVALSAQPRELRCWDWLGLDAAAQPPADPARSHRAGSTLNQASEVELDRSAPKKTAASCSPLGVPIS
jgi:4'-phosphopantetheinyl transferase